jgi:tRNA-dihydrouridine synthase
MDGVTDAPYRFITAKHGKPDVHFTEFTNVEGLGRDATVMLDDFL